METELTANSPPAPLARPECRAGFLFGISFVSLNTKVTTNRKTIKPESDPRPSPTGHELPRAKSVLWTKELPKNYAVFRKRSTETGIQFDALGLSGANRICGITEESVDGGEDFTNNPAVVVEEANSPNVLVGLRSETVRPSNACTHDCCGYVAMSPLYVVLIKAWLYVV